MKSGRHCYWSSLLPEHFDGGARVLQGVVATGTHPVMATQVRLSPSRAELLTGVHREVVVNDVDDPSRSEISKSLSISSRPSTDIELRRSISRSKCTTLDSTMCAPIS